MKKVYSAPKTLCMELDATNMIALSTNDFQQITSENVGDYEQNVKGGTKSYNVWDDNWSE